MDKTDKTQIEEMDDWCLLSNYYKGQESIGIIYSRHYKYVFSICYRILGNEKDAEDAASKVFMRIIEKFRTKEPYVGAKFTTLIWKISHDIALSESIKINKNIKLEEDIRNEVYLNNEDDRETHENLIQNEEIESFEKGLKLLTNKEKLAVLLRYKCEMKWKDIADNLGLPHPSSASEAAKIAIDKLRKYIYKEHGKDYE